MNTNKTQNNTTEIEVLTDLEPVGEVKGGPSDRNGDGTGDVIIIPPIIVPAVTPRPRGITIVAH